MLALGLAALAPSAVAASPYAGQESREIKALSPEEISSLLSGKGMGFAKAAELNGFALRGYGAAPEHGTPRHKH